MLSYEQVGKLFVELVSGSFLISKWKSVDGSVEDAL